MINSNKVIEQLHRMSYDELETLAKEILEESHIPYTYDDTGILFDGLVNNTMFCADAVFQYSQQSNFIIQESAISNATMNINAYEVLDIDEDYLDAA